MNARTTRMTVAVSQRVDFVEGRGEVRDAVDQRLVQWLVQAGCMPVPVPNSLADPGVDAANGREGESAGREANDPRGGGLREWLGRVRPRAVVLSGGNDIGDIPARDATEAELLDAAAAEGWPVLGICRGMQMMAVHAGGALRRLENHVAVRHHLQQEEEGEGPWPETVNSYHELALEGCPPDHRVLARAEDGSIEAIAHRELKREGWMWHPEREETFAEADTKRLRRLFGL